MAFCRQLIACVSRVADRLIDSPQPRAQRIDMRGDDLGISCDEALQSGDAFEQHPESFSSRLHRVYTPLESRSDSRNPGMSALDLSSILSLFLGYPKALTLK
jgi:hypothetical protein